MDYLFLLLWIFTGLPSVVSALLVCPFLGGNLSGSVQPMISPMLLTPRWLMCLFGLKQASNNLSGVLSDCPPYKTKCKHSRNVSPFLERCLYNQRLKNSYLWSASILGNFSLTPKDSWLTLSECSLIACTLLQTSTKSSSESDMMFSRVKFYWRYTDQSVMARSSIFGGLGSGHSRHHSIAYTSDFSGLSLLCRWKVSYWYWTWS